MIHDLRALQLYCDLVETRSFSLTAERNFITQSAVSQRIRTLEKEFNRSLIERSSGQRGILVTPAGETLYEGAKELLQRSSELIERLQEIGQEVAGIVRVVTVYSVGLHALPKRLKPFLAQYPKINVHLEYSQTSRVVQEVLSGKVDVGIIACPTPRQGLTLYPFEEDEMALICAPEHPLAKRSEVSLAELSGLPFIAFDAHIPTRRLIDEKLRQAGADVEIITTFDNIETIKNLVEIGSGISILPLQSTKREANEKALKVVPLCAEDAFTRPTGLLVKQTNLRSAVRAFVSAMSQDRH